MNDWTPPAIPHANHPKFPFHATNRNPVKGGKPKLGKHRPSFLANPKTPTEQFETMCASLLTLIDSFNDATMKCKAAAAAAADTDQSSPSQGPMALVTPGVVATIHYTAAVTALNKFMGKNGEPDPGYQKYVTPGSFNIEVVMSHGFVVGARIFGLPLAASTPLQVQGQSLSSIIDELRLPPSSSSYYSIYSP